MNNLPKEKANQKNCESKNLIQIRVDKEFIKKTAEKELAIINKILERPNILPDEELDRLEMLYEAFLNIRDLY